MDIIRIDPKKPEVTNIVISDSGVDLPGILTVPENSSCIVLFAHGSGSSRFSTRNNYVAGILNKAGIATLLFDLLTEEESLDRSNVFDIGLLSERLLFATKWISKNELTGKFKIGYFGASTGAAAALMASIKDGDVVGAIVSRGGRPDLAFEILKHVSAPTLFLVGAKDYGVLELNEKSYDEMTCVKKFEIVPDATHLFEEPGTLEYVADAAKLWFLAHLANR